ncbi:MAG: TonB-dependent receptor [Gemmatimonadota bacterium]|nr:TonB-dependent receptor [Gemmatimonadota bacterium]
MVLTLLTLAAQQTTLTGVVRDSTSLEPVAFAEVRVSSSADAARTAAGVTDRFGAFAIPGAPSGTVRIEANAFGYTGWAGDYDELPAGPIEILLAPSPILLDPLGVEAASRKGDPISVSRDAFVVDPAMIRTIPTVLETDVLRVIAMSPSASAPSDFVSVPYVRGGTSDGTPVMLDGVRLFNPFHLGGFLSAVNAEAVDHATLLPSSGAGAQHVGSLSGAIEIATRDGARDRHRAAGAVGLASSRLTVEGPLGGSTSYLVDGRRTYVDLLTRGLAWAGVIEEHFPYSFSDLHAKVTRDFGGFRRLSVTGYVNTEGVRYEDAQVTTGRERATARGEYVWGNAAVAAHYRDRLRGGALLDVTVGHSRFGSNLLVIEDLDRPVPDTSVSGGGHMAEDRVDVRATWHLSRGTLTAGGQAIRFAGYHDYLDSDLEDILPPVFLDDLQWRISAFSNLDAPLGRSWRTRAGVRLDHFAGVASTFAPFAELSYAGAWWEARISAARSHQSLASLRNEESVGASFLAYDLMVPVKNGPVPGNTEVTAGWEGAWGAWRLRLDAYARRMENLRLPELPEDPLGAWVLGDPSLHEAGSGTAAGVEASWSWAGGPLSTVGSYRWSRATRTVGGMTYVPRFHREHELEYGAALESGRSVWSARFSLKSGQPTTPIAAVVPVWEQHPWGTHYLTWVTLEGEYNAGRLPHYLRLDLGWRRRRQGSAVGERFIAPFVSVANLFSRPNVLAADVQTDFDGYYGDYDGVRVERHYFPQMPMLVFFGVEFRF